MKTIIAFISIIIMGFTFSSCSDHSSDTVNPIPDSITLKVDGVQKTFTNVVVAQSSFLDTNENETVPTYNVLANYEDDNGEYIAFQVRRDYTGSGGLYQFIYTTPNGSHSLSQGFTFATTQNTAAKLTGTFSGPLFDTPDTTTPSVIITEGAFDVNF